jgi:NO-binding membrane sensor protein with MHYT domain
MDQDHFEHFEGHVVGKVFNPYFVALSYVISLLGALATLELINRRTSPKGKCNHVLLMASAVTMGGIAIWCMVSWCRRGVLSP